MWSCFAAWKLFYFFIIVMELTKLTAISPIDGRYGGVTAPLADFYSEYALMRYRVRVEVEYFIALCESGLAELRGVPCELFASLRDLYVHFKPVDAVRIKEHERVTNHDVKAVEYFLKEEFEAMGLGEYEEFIHFGLTSQDINNTATPLLIKESLEVVLYPALDELTAKLSSLAEEWRDVAMLAHTHGQPASPTRLGKEMEVYVYRLSQALECMRSVPVTGKFGGATGNMNAHRAAYPERDWPSFADAFLRDYLGIGRERVTTQISNYDNLSALFDALKRVNSIILDLDRDMWMYISMDYFKQRIKAGEVGSSAMPHKVNPIDYENSEGNLGMANAILSHLSVKLPVSRLQRDLTDSTVLRNVGVPVAHSLIAVRSTLRGLDKLLLNGAALRRDLDAHWAVVAEGIQTILRRIGYPKPYEALKALTRTNGVIDRHVISEFIDSLDVEQGVRDELHALSPETYLGY